MKFRGLIQILCLRTIRVVLVIWFISVEISYGQYIDHSLLNRPTPTTPEASALLKFVDSPVSHFNGTADISIPLYEIQGLDVKLQIVLSFSTGGLQVDEVASWVGYGWSLNTTGVIGRTIVDIPDDWQFGYSSPGSRAYFRANGTPILDSCNNLPYQPSAEEYNYWLDQTYSYYMSTNRSTSLHSSGENYLDTEPDVFTFSTPSGPSGKFVFDLNGKINMIPKKPIKIEMFDNTSINEKEFNIYDDRGIRYYFGSATERINSNTVCSNLSGSDQYGLDPISSWYLSSIYSPRTKESIDFSYVPQSVSYPSSISETKSFIAVANGGTSRSTDLDAICNTTTTINGVRLTQIEMADIRVTFEVDASPRLDLNGGYRLKRIHVIAGNDTIKQFIFYHSYLNNSYLKLDSLVEYGSNGVRLPAYKFTYNTTGNLPYRGSLDRDHWGYFNGAGNTTLLPSYQSYVEQINFLGANRESNEVAMKKGSLIKITYPTGGFTEFEYEANTIKESVTVEPSVTVQANSLSPAENGFHVDTEDFTLTEETYVEIVGVDYWMDEQGGISASSGVEIIGLSNSYYQQILPDVDGRFLLLPAGNYRLRAFNEQYTSPSEYVFCSIKWKITTSHFQNKHVGGLRIKTIKKFDGVTSTPQLVKRITYTDSAGFSTGKLFVNNYYWYDIQFGNGYPGHEYTNICFDEQWTITHRILKSNSLIQQIQVQGSVVGYNQVTETFESLDGNLGKTVYQYLNNSNGITLHLYPQVQSTALNYKQNFLLSKSEYDVSDQLLSVQTNYPKFGMDEGLIDRIYGFQVVKQLNDGCVRCSFIFSDYFHLSEPMEIDSTVTIQYESGNPLITASKNVYDPVYVQGINSDYFYLLRRTRNYDSSGKKWTVEFEYPFDFRTVDSRWNAVYAYNLFTPVLQYVYLPDEFIKDAKIISFNDDLQPTKYFGFDNEFSLSRNSLRQITNLDNPENGFFLREEYDYLSDRLISAKSDQNLTNSFIWKDNTSGYKQYPAALVTNALPNEVYFTSFEDGGGTIGLSKTGSKYFSGTPYTIPVADRPSGVNLVMTFWYYDGSWKFQPELPYNPIISKVNATRYDEIRVYPKGAQMTTYTYQQGVGVSSVTDANNVTSYYEYDSFGRLKLIKDDKGNVLQHYTYNYKQN